MRWFLLLGTCVAVVLCCTRHGPGAMAFWLMVGIVGAIATVLAFAQARISANSQTELVPDVLLQQLGKNKPPQE